MHHLMIHAVTLSELSKWKLEEAEGTFQGQDCNEKSNPAPSYPQPLMLAADDTVGV